MDHKGQTLSRFARLLPAIMAIVLELLPSGAVCIFAPNPTDRVRQTFSYFDPTPFGYANFGPLLTAILSCLLLAAAGFMLFKDTVRIRKCALALSLAAAITSLLPLVFGTSYYTLTAAGITLCLVSEYAMLRLGKQTAKGDT